MITYYSHPIPGFGVSFYHLIVDQGLDLSNQLNHSIVQELWDRLTNLYWGMETPGLTIALNILEIFRYTVTIQSSAPEDQVRKCKETIDRKSPVRDTLANPVNIVSTLVYKPR